MIITSPSGVNLGQLIRGGLVLQTREAVAVTHDVCRRADRSRDEEVVFAQSPDDLWIAADGELSFVRAETSSTTADPRTAAAALLDALLPPPDERPEYAVPASLRSLPTRLRASVETVPHFELQDLLSILQRQLRDDPRQVLQQLVTRATDPVKTVERTPDPVVVAPAVVPPPALITVHHSDNALEFFDAEPATEIESAASATTAPQATNVEVTPVAPPVAVGAVAADRPTVMATAEVSPQQFERPWGTATPAATPVAPAVSAVPGQAAIPVVHDLDVIRRPDTWIAEEPRPTVYSRSPRPSRGAGWAAALALVAGSGYAGYTYVRHSAGVEARTAPPAVSAREEPVAPAAAAPARKPAVKPEPPTVPAPVVVEPDAPEPSPPAAAVQPVTPSFDPPPPSSAAVRETDPGETISGEADVAVDEAPRPLTLPVQDGAFSPSFAPTGRALLFHSGRNSTGRLLEAGLDASGVPARVTPLDTPAAEDGARNYHPRLSPDERQIAFDSDRDGERGVYVSARDGSGATRVSGSGFAAVPSWSPDMKWLAFIKGEPSRPRVWNLWLRDLASGEVIRHTSFRAGQVWGASWFPDGQRLCYSHEDKLIVADLASGRRETFPTPMPGRLVRTPAVSPDGKRIVFQVLRDGVWILDLPTGSMRRILDDVTAEEFAWEPDGRRIAYHSRQDGTWRIWLAGAPPA